MHFNPYNINFSPQELVQELDRYIVGQQRLKRDVALTLWNHLNYLQLRDAEKAGNMEKSNLFIWGPTGTGKTETCRKAFEILGLPHLIVDITSYTDAGYIGNKVENIVQNYLANIGDIEIARYGVIHIDEIDKKHKNERAGIDVSGGRVQHQLLKIIEGENVAYTRKAEDNKSKGSESFFDTAELLFFVSGAFEGIEKQAKFSQQKKSLGFQSERRQKNKTSSEPTLDDFRSYGMLPEFLRRFGTFSRTEKLNEEDLYNILKLETCKPINSSVENFQRSQIELAFSDESLRKIASIAAKQGTGASGLKAVINSVLNDFQYELADRDISRLLITAEIVENPRAELDSLVRELASKKNRVKKSIFSAADQDGPEDDEKDDWPPKTPQSYRLELESRGINFTLARVSSLHLWEKGYTLEQALDLFVAYNDRIDNYEVEFFSKYEKGLTIYQQTRALVIGEDLNHEFTNVEFVLDNRFKFFNHVQEIKGSPLEVIALNVNDFKNPDRFYQRIVRGKLW